MNYQFGAKAISEIKSHNESAKERHEEVESYQLCRLLRREGAQTLQYKTVKSKKTTEAIVATPDGIVLCTTDDTDNNRQTKMVMSWDGRVHTRVFPGVHFSRPAMAARAARFSSEITMGMFKR